MLHRHVAWEPRMDKRNSQRSHDVRESRFIVLVLLKPDFQNACKHFSLTEIILNQISQSRANTPIYCE